MIISARHGRTGDEERDVDSDGQQIYVEKDVKIAVDGLILVSDFLRQKASRCLDITAEDVADFLEEDQRRGGRKGKRRFEARYHKNGSVAAFAAMQGHSFSEGRRKGIQGFLSSFSMVLTSGTLQLSGAEVCWLEDLLEPGRRSTL